MNGHQITDKKIRFPVFPRLNHQFLSDRLVDVVFNTMLKPKPQNEGEKLKISLWSYISGTLSIWYSYQQLTNETENDRMLNITK